MMYKYHCSCCNEAVSATQKVCHKCGSQHIKSPYGLWIFCLVACFVTVVTFKVGHFYFQNHQLEEKTQPSLLEFLKQDSESETH